MTNILSFSDVPNYIKTLKQQGKSIVVVGGCFDILHLGHINLLENAKKQGDVLFVYLESDSSIKKRKGIDRPIHNQEQRAYMLSRIKDVDEIILLPDTMKDKDYDNLIKLISPSVIATTQGDSGIEHKKRQAKIVGAKLVEVNKYLSNLSTTKILEKLSEEI